MSDPVPDPKTVVPSGSLARLFLPMTAQQAAVMAQVKLPCC